MMTYTAGHKQKHKKIWYLLYTVFIIGIFTVQPSESFYLM